MDRKNSQNWKEEDLQSLVKNKIEEDSDLDYKDSRSLMMGGKEMTELSKDVSSFANSSGGIIIYGISENKHVPEKIDEGCNPTEITKEWLEQVIQGRIRPRIEGVDINPVSLDITSPGRVAYVVTIPQGVTAHQAYDKKYYKRFNFNAEPMYDYEIRDVMNRVKVPNVQPKFEYTFYDSRRVLLVSLVNEGEIGARNIKLSFLWPTTAKRVDDVRGFEKRPNENFEGEMFEKFEVLLLNRFLFPNDIIKLFEFDFAFHFVLDEKDSSDLDAALAKKLFLKWDVWADNMPVRSGRLEIYDIPRFESFK